MTVGSHVSLSGWRVFFFAALLTGCGAPVVRPSVVQGPFVVENDDTEIGEDDPMIGIDPDGRIPKVDLPEDLPNPDRWRYVPEGRILPGNIIDRLFVSSFAIPLFFFEEDIGAGGGVSITDIDFRNQRRQEFAGAFLSYSSEGQQSYRFAWRRWQNQIDLPSGIAQEERNYLSARGGYRRTLTRRFYGKGADTRESAETSFTDEVANVGFSRQFTLPRPGDDLVLDIGVLAEHRNLSHGEISDVADTKTDFPQLFSDGDSYDSAWVTAGVRIDTRDSQHNPYCGYSIGISTEAAPLQTGGELGGTATVEGSIIFPVPGLLHDGGGHDEEHPPTDAIAFGGLVTTTYGDLPFWALPSLGGSHTLRGYIGNRFTDDAAWHLSGEYRFWPIPRGFSITKRVRVERLGVALFYEVGSVGPGFYGLAADDTKASYGFSLRASLERQALFRADFGYSEEGFGFNAAYGLSF